MDVLELSFVQEIYRSLDQKYSPVIKLINKWWNTLERFNEPK